MRIITVPIAQLTAHPANYRQHPPEQIEALVASLRYHKQPKPVVVTGDMVILAGHGLVEAATVAGWKEIVCSVYEGESPEAYLVADNEIPQKAVDDPSKLADLLQELDNGGFDMAATGYSEEELARLMHSLDEAEHGEGAGSEAHVPFTEQFGAPPFTVLDARQGYWLDRKRAWAGLGVNADDGTRDGVLQGLESAGTIQGISLPTTSCFDPVLAEICLRWFCPPGGHVLDPFGGEATKGLVAGYLGYPYTGVELRPEQVAVNQGQARAMPLAEAPVWLCGDSAQLTQHLPPGQAYDLLFTSPPYYDLEVYSSKAQDGSTFGTYPEFRAWLADIYRQAVDRLWNNRFVVVKVGEVRDKAGAYYNFVGDTITMMMDLGLAYYNEAILVTPIGTMPVRAGKPFSSARKLCKGHQNVLVFYKGDLKAISKEFPSTVPGADLALIGEGSA